MVGFFLEPDASAKVASMAIDPLVKQRTLDVLENGYAIIKSGISPQMCRETIATFRRLESANAAIFAENRKEDGHYPRIVNLHTALPDLVHLLTRNPVLLQVLDTLFGTPVALYTSLFYEVGSQQPLHRDTPVFCTRPEYLYFGTTVYLEPTDDDNGCLEVMEKGHLMPELDREAMALRHFGSLNDVPDIHNEIWGEYQNTVTANGVAKGLQTKKLHVSAGDTVIWHPQLPHGGSPIRDKDRTRFSLVMHVTPVGVPVYHQSVFFRPSFSFPEKAPWGFREVDGRQIADIRNGINFDHKNGYSLDRIKPPGEAVAPTNLRKTGRGRMHWEQNNFIQSVKCLFPNFFKAVSVLEIGSYDVNGSVRPQFEATRYVGVDLITGPGVDVISTGHEFRSEERFDVAISTECFEHDPFYTATFLNMVRHVREGGLVIFSCAAEGRPEHGTRRAEPASSPGTVAQGYDYYRNLSEADFAFLDLPVLFSEFRFFHNSTSNDLYFVGVKRHSELLRQIDTLCKAVESLPGQIDGAFGLLRSGKTDEALERMQAVYKSAPSSARDYVLMRQGWLLNEAKRGAAAEAVVREALTLSDAAELYWELGTILHGLGRAAEAIAPAREAVKRAPDDARFVYFLGAMLQNQNVLEEAKELLKRTISLDPKFAPAHQQLSAVLTKQGRQEEAIEEARNAAELAPEVAWIQGHLERMLSPQDVPAHNRSN